jgi:hypothetical protein
MSGQQEPMVGCHDLLLSLDALIFKLKDVAAVFTDQVVVVLTLDDGLIARLPIPEVSLVRNPSVCEELHGPVDGRVSDALHVPLDSHRKVFYGDMALRVEECTQDGTPLPGVFKIIALQMLLKELCEMSNISHHSPPRRT